MSKYTKDNIPEPTMELIKQYSIEFDENENLNEEVVRIVFEGFDYSCQANVLTKVIILNNRYSTWLNDYPTVNSDKVDVVTMSKYLFDNRDFLRSKHESEEVIEWIDNAIKHFRDLGKDVPYSFLTKFCAWNFTDLDIPIVDSYTKAMLYYINKQHNFYIIEGKQFFSQADISEYNYNFYCKVFKQFADKYANGMSYKVIDKYLWLFGKQNDIHF